MRVQESGSLYQRVCPVKLLGLDTSTEACSAALSIGDEVIERFELVRHDHSARLLPMVRSVLSEAGVTLRQCDAIAFGRGPGSFTALRIGAGVVQGLAFGADLPVLPVSSLAVLAEGQDAGHVIAAVDARMDQLYWGCYARGRGGLVAPVIDDQLGSPATVRAPDGPEWRGAGSGWDRYADRLLLALGGRAVEWRPDQYPHAGALLRLAEDLYRRGGAVDAAGALPTYLRDDVAKKSR